MSHAQERESAVNALDFILQTKSFLRAVFLTMQKKHMTGALKSS
jgi:hypothetical protein